MAVEIPSSLIRQIQDVLRREAGIPEFGVVDPTLPGLPSFEQAVSGLDPSAPPYLRCEGCQAPLARGLLSTTCVYCGSEQRRDPPLSMSFSATLGCRKLLQSLDLDGSETVEQNTEPKNSKNREIEKDGLVLSSLLGIEIMWPSEEQKMQTCTTVSTPTETPLNLSGLDLDSFFSETKREVDSSAHESSEKMVMFDRERNSEDFGPFEEFHSANKTVISVEIESSGIHDSSGAWEAEFQSSTMDVPSTASNSKDFFQNSFSSNYVNTGIVEESSVASEMNKQGRSTALSSNSDQIPPMSNDWPLDDLWYTSGSVISSTPELVSGKVNNNADELKSSTMGPDWAQTDLWPPVSATGPIANEIANDDSFDEWQEFTSSGNAQDSSPSSLTQTSTAATLTNEREEGISSVSFTNMNKDLDFGSFVQPDLPPGLSDFGRMSTNLEMPKLRASFSGRMNDGEEAQINGDLFLMADKNTMLSSTNAPGSGNADVQDLLSQMHDLSFMLEDSLSIPKKVEPSV